MISNGIFLRDSKILFDTDWLSHEPKLKLRPIFLEHHRNRSYLYLQRRCLSILRLHFLRPFFPQLYHYLANALLLRFPPVLSYSDDHLKNILIENFKMHFLLELKSYSSLVLLNLIVPIMSSLSHLKSLFSKYNYKNASNI